MTEPLPPLLNIPMGYYRHYKGGLYQVLGAARHSESLEAMTIYRACYGDRGTWVRPSAMFLEQVEVNGQPTPRFRFIGAEAPPSLTV